jgi:hypothetical protein
MNITKLRGLIQESIQEYLKEIDAAGDRAAVEAKMAKIDEAIKNREDKISRAEALTEDEDMKEMVNTGKIASMKKEIKLFEKAKAKYQKQLDKMDGKTTPKKEIDEFNMDQFSMGGQSSAPKASFGDKWNAVPGANKEVLAKSTGQEPILVMASSNGSNHLITKGSDNKFYLYTYTQAANPGKPKGPFNSEEEAKKQKMNEKKENMNESFIRMQKLAGLITESDYKEKTDEVAGPYSTNRNMGDDIINNNADEVYQYNMFDRMDILANIQDLNTLKTKLRLLVSDWYNEGFEKEDIQEYMNSLIDEI